jgi:hypothetical protein
VDQAFIQNLADAPAYSHSRCALLIDAESGDARGRQI